MASFLLYFVSIHSSLGLTRNQELSRNGYAFGRKQGMRNPITDAAEPQLNGDYRPTKSRVLVASSIGLNEARRFAMQMKACEMTQKHGGVKIMFAINCFELETQKCNAVFHTINPRNSSGYAGLKTNVIGGNLLLFSNLSGHKPLFWKKHLGPETLANFDYIWWVDSDVIFDPRVFPISTFLLTAWNLGAYIIQPAIAGMGANTSSSSYPVLRVDGGKSPGHYPWWYQKGMYDHIAQEVPVVEMMAPLFTRRAWLAFHEALRPMRDDLLRTNAWGAEDAWCELATMLAIHDGKPPSLGCIVLRSVSILHTDSKTLEKENHHKWGGDFRALNQKFRSENWQHVHNKSVHHYQRPSGKHAVGKAYDVEDILQ